jgi:hypothetical protein
MRAAAAAWLACAALSLWLLSAERSQAQPASSEPTVTAPVDWAAVRAQLVARTTTRLRQAPATVRDLVPPGYGAARSLSLRPRIPVLIPLFALAANGNGAGRTLGPAERNYLPVSQSGVDASGRALAPNAPAAAQPETMLFPESNTYAATIKLPQGAVVTISGSNVARALTLNDGAARALSGRAGESIGRYQMSDVLIEQTETGHGISFTRFGVAYNIEIGCVVLMDIRCTDPEFVRELAFSMSLVGEPPP